MKNHDLKCDPIPFAAMLAGVKTVEIRRNDRDFMVGDWLILKETKFSSGDMHHDGMPLLYTGRELQREVTDVTSAYGVSQGFVALSIRPPRGEDHDFKRFHQMLCERFGYPHDDKDWRRDTLSLIEHIANPAPDYGSIDLICDKCGARKRMPYTDATKTRIDIRPATGWEIIGRGPAGNQLQHLCPKCSGEFPMRKLVVS